MFPGHDMNNGGNVLHARVVSCCSTLYCSNNPQESKITIVIELVNVQELRFLV